VHGICHGAWCWQEHYTPYFSGHGFETHALDLRGHGADARDGLEQLTLEDYAADVIKAAAALTSPPVVIGHSMGGAITQLVLRDRPDVLSGAVLLASMPPSRPTALEMLRLQRSPLGGLALQKLVKGKPLSPSEVQRLPFFGGRITRAEAERYGPLLQAESQSAIRGLLKLSLPRTTADIPVLVIGSRQDRIFGAATVRRSAAHFGVEPVVLDTGCHDLMLDPGWEESALLILAWLKDRS
jgi:pimeloyl-ACP methyl ester carboxylesterase